MVSIAPGVNNWLSTTQVCKHRTQHFHWSCTSGHANTAACDVEAYAQVYLCIIQWQAHGHGLGRCCAIIPCITIILTPVLHLVTQDTPHHPPHASAAADDAAAEQPSEADAGNASSHRDAAGTHGCPEPSLAAAVVDAVSAQCQTDTADNATEPLRAVGSGPPWASSLALAAAAAAAVDEAVAAGERSQECGESSQGCGL